MEYLTVIFFSYLCGSIPFGLILTKLFTNKDIRKIGSGNIGATNVLRTGNKYLAVGTLILDALKGYIPIIITKHFSPELIELSCLLAFLGHLFPVWLNFKGGKGVATYVGMLFCINYILGFVFIICWFVIFIVSRYSSLSSLIASLTIPIYHFFIIDNNNYYFFIILFILIFFTHRENVKRLINNTESKTKIY